HQALKLALVYHPPPRGEMPIWSDHIEAAMSRVIGSGQGTLKVQQQTNMLRQRWRYRCHPLRYDNVACQGNIEGRRASLGRYFVCARRVARKIQRDEAGTHELAQVGRTITRRLYHAAWTIRRFRTERRRSPPAPPAH